MKNSSCIETLGVGDGSKQDHIGLVHILHGALLVRGVHRLLGNRISVRIRGIDAPEIQGKCEAEKRKAIEARDFLNANLSSAGRIDLLDVARGKYFRIVAIVLADGIDMAEALMGKGLARPYDETRARNG